MTPQEQLYGKLLAPFEDDPERQYPLDAIVPLFAAWREEFYRVEVWDQNTAEVGQHREWFLNRKAGLRAFAAYEARIALSPFARNQTIRGDGFIEAMIHHQIRDLGLKTLSEWEPGFFDWDDFLKFKRLNDPKFFVRLGQWLSKGGDLDSYNADRRIKLYASLYDRALVPFEYCSDAYAAGAINRLMEVEGWPGPNKKTNPLAVQGWRRLLKLSLANPLIVRSARDGTPLPANFEAARRHGLPFAPSDGPASGLDPAAQK